MPVACLVFYLAKWLVQLGATPRLDNPICMHIVRAAERREGCAGMHAYTCIPLGDDDQRGFHHPPVVLAWLARLQFCAWWSRADPCDDVTPLSCSAPVWISAHLLIPGCVAHVSRVAHACGAGQPAAALHTQDDTVNNRPNTRHQYSVVHYCAHSNRLSTRCLMCFAGAPRLLST